MNKFFSAIYLEHKHFWRENTYPFIGSALFFVFALMLQHFAYSYIDNRAITTHVGDLLLDNLPTVDLDFLVVQAALLISALVGWLFFRHPRYLIFSLKTLALFIIVRSFFISLTHLGANLHQITLDSNSLGFGMYDFLYNAKNDFFFSGHVGSPFMFGLIFWKKTIWRNIFFAASFILGATMLLAHMHYSIDVFAAPFITYGIFVVAKKVFKKDYQLINEEVIN